MIGVTTEGGNHTARTRSTPASLYHYRDRRGSGPESVASSGVSPCSSPPAGSLCTGTRPPQRRDSHPARRRPPCRRHGALEKAALSSAIPVAIGVAELVLKRPTDHGSMAPGSTIGQRTRVRGQMAELEWSPQRWVGHHASRRCGELGPTRCCNSLPCRQQLPRTPRSGGSSCMSAACEATWYRASSGITWTARTRIPAVMHVNTSSTSGSRRLLHARFPLPAPPVARRCPAGLSPPGVPTRRGMSRPGS